MHIQFLPLILLIYLYCTFSKINAYCLHYNDHINSMIIFHSWITFCCPCSLTSFCVCFLVFLCGYNELIPKLFSNYSNFLLIQSNRLVCFNCIFLKKPLWSHLTCSNLSGYWLPLCLMHNCHHHTEDSSYHFPILDFLFLYTMSSFFSVSLSFWWSLSFSSFLSKYLGANFLIH